MSVNRLNDYDFVSSETYKLLKDSIFSVLLTLKALPDFHSLLL